MARNEEEILLEIVRRFNHHCKSINSWPSQSFREKVRVQLNSYIPLTRMVLFEKTKVNKRRIAFKHPGA